MPKRVFTIVDNFYNAAWDLAENLFRLNLHAGQGDACQVNVVDPEQGELPLTLPAIRAQFEKFSAPFLSLTGQDLPRGQHLPYTEIEDCLNETVFPALEVLAELWDDRLAGTEGAQSRFDDGCIHINHAVEMILIPQASGMVQDLKPA